MATLNPVINPNIQPEGVVQSASILGAAADIGSSLLDSLGQAPAPTATDRKHDALIPLSTQLQSWREQLDDGNLPSAQFATLSRMKVSSFISTNPEYQDEALGFLDSISRIGAAPLDVPTIDIQKEARQAFAATTLGQNALRNSVSYNADNSIDAETTAINFEVAFAKDLAMRAQIAATAQQITAAQGDNTLRTALGKQAVSDTSPIHFLLSTDAVDGILTAHAAGYTDFDEDTEVLFALEEEVRKLTSAYTADYLSMGVDASEYSPAILEALKPINNLIASIGNNAEHLSTVVAANESAATLGVQKEFVKIFGNAGMTDAFMRPMMELLATGARTRGEFIIAGKTLQDRIDAGLMQSTQSIIPTVGGVVPEGAAPESFEAPTIVTPELINHFSSMEGGLKDMAVREAITNGSITLKALTLTSSPELVDKAVQDYGFALAAAASMTEPLSNKYLVDLLGSTNKSLSMVINSGSQSGGELGAVLASLTSTELRKNQARLGNLVAQLPVGFSVDSTGAGGTTAVVFDRRAFILSEAPDNVRVREALQRNGVEVNEANVLKALRDNIQTPLAPLGGMMGSQPSVADVTAAQGDKTQFGQMGNLNAIEEHINNINLINSSLSSMPTVKDAVFGAVAGSTVEDVQTAVQGKGPQDLISVAESTLGWNEDQQTEILGQFLRSGGANIDPRETAWCAAFVNSVLSETGLDGTGKLNARSFLGWGTEVTEPQQGDIVVLSRGSNPAQGHVGFFKGYDTNGDILILGGNQGDSVSVSSYSADRLLGFRRADGVPVAKSNSEQEQILGDVVRRVASEPNFLPVSRSGTNQEVSSGQLLTPADISADVMSALTNNGSDPATTKEYATEEEAQAALDRGEVEQGDIVVIAGKAVRIEDDDNESAPTEALSFNTPFEGSKLPVSDYPDVPEGISGILKDNRANPSTTLVFGSKEEFEKASSNLPEDTTHVLIAGILYPVGVAQ